MSRGNKKMGFIRTVAVFFLASFLLISLFSTVPIGAQQSLPIGKKFVIAFDLYHNPILRPENFSLALSKLNESLPVDIGFIDVSLDNKVLSGVDLLVLPPKGNGKPYSDDEARAISKYLEMGGSLLVMGLFNKSFDEGGMNSLLSKVSVLGKPLSSLLSFDVHEVEGVEDSVYLYDDFSPFEQKYILELHPGGLPFKTNATKVIAKSIAVKSESTETKKFFATSTTYGRDSNGVACCYLNDTPLVAAFWEKNRTRVSILGFGDAFSDLISPLDSPWISLGDNLELFISLFEWLLKPEFFQPKQLVRPGYVYTYLAGSSLLVLPFVFVVKKVEEQRAKKKEKPKKLSELLKKSREA